MFRERKDYIMLFYHFNRLYGAGDCCPKFALRFRAKPSLENIHGKHPTYAAGNM